MKSTTNTTPKRGRPQGQSRSEFQCVSFLTDDGLHARLSKLVDDGIIGHYWFVHHDADEDDKKPHQHVRMTPPISRSVDWAWVVATVVEMVDGESLPRRLVVKDRAANNKGLDGLLYARHDANYCAVKCLGVKARYDYPRAAFITDDDDWLDGLWAESDRFTPTRRRLGTEELLVEVERNPRMSRLDLLRLCLLNGATKGTKDMLDEYRRELLATQTPRYGQQPEYDPDPNTEDNDHDYPATIPDPPELPGFDYIPPSYDER